MQVQDQQLRDKALQALSSMSSAQIVSASLTTPGGVTDLVTQLMHQPQAQQQQQQQQQLQLQANQLNPLAANNNNTLAAAYAQHAGLMPNSAAAAAAAASLMPNLQMNLHIQQQLSNQMALLAGGRVAPGVGVPQGVAPLPFAGATGSALQSPSRNHVSRYYSAFALLCFALSALQCLNTSACASTVQCTL